MTVSSSSLRVDISTVATHPIIRNYGYGYGYSAYPQFGGSSDYVIGYGYAFRSEKWQIVLEAIANAIYGYGYGLNFEDPLNPNVPPDLDYFNIFGISGLLYGYGIENTPGFGVTIGPYQYGWGYEYSDSVLANGQNTLRIRALVTEDGVPVSNIRVSFFGWPSTYFNPDETFTDSNGYAYVDVSVEDSDTFNSLVAGGSETHFVSMAKNGFLSIKAIVDQRPRVDEGKYNVSVEGTQSSSSSGTQRVYIWPAYSESKF